MILSSHDGHLGLASNHQKKLPWLPFSNSYKYYVIYRRYLNRLRERIANIKQLITFCYILTMSHYLGLFDKGTMIAVFDLGDDSVSLKWYPALDGLKLERIGDDVYTEFKKAHETE